MKKWLILVSTGNSKRVPDISNPAEMMSGGEKVLALVALPPPTHGQSVVNSAVVSKLRSEGLAKVVVIDTGPGRSQRGLGYHAVRLLRLTAALGHLIRHSTSNRRTLYTVVESGWGIIYNFAVIGLARVLRYRVVLHHHTSGHTLIERPAFRSLARVAGPRAIHVVLGSAMADDLKRYQPSVGEIMVVNNAAVLPVPVEVTLPGCALPEIKLGVLSNLSDDKGLDVALSVLRQSIASGLNVVLILAGPLATEKSKADVAAARLEFGPALEVLGPISGEEKTAFFNLIDVFLFPSRYRFEAQPLVVLEAMAHCRPVVVTNSGYTAELVGAAGRVSNPNEFSLAALDLCKEFLADRDFLRQRSKDALKRYQELRGLGATELEFLIQRLCNRTPSELG